MKNQKIISIFIFLCSFNSMCSMHRIVLSATKSLKPIVIRPWCSTLTKPNFSYRSIISSFDTYKNTYNAFNKNKHFSPIYGFLYANSGVLETIYNLHKINNQSSATEKLVTTFFHKNGEQFLDTRLKTSPAYSISPEILAQIIANINILSSPKIRIDICNKWKEQHLLKTASKVSNKKIDEILDTITKSKEESLKQCYLPDTTENILLSVLHYKSDNKKDLSSYIKEIDKLTQSIHDIDYSNEEDFSYEKQRLIRKIPGNHNLDHYVIDNFKRYIENFEYIVADLNFVKGNKRLPNLVQQNYSFKNQLPRPNCVETCFHQLCNILLFNKKTNKFDVNLLPEHIKPNPKLIDFFKLQDFKPDKINTKIVGQEFMNIVSDHDFLKYVSGNYELKSCLENFIPLMNYLFGTKAKNLEELSALLSYGKRDIKFNSDDGDVSISLTYNNILDSKYRLCFGDRHAELKKISVKDDLDMYYPYMYWKNSKYISIYPELAALIEFPDEFDIKSFKKDYAIEDLLHIIHLPYIKSVNQCLDILDVLCSKIKEHPYIEKYILYILNKFSNDQHFVQSAIGTITKYKVDSISSPIGLWCAHYLFVFLKFKSVEFDHLRSRRNRRKYNLDREIVNNIVTRIALHIPLNSKTFKLLDIIDNGSYLYNAKLCVSLKHKIILQYFEQLITLINKQEKFNLDYDNIYHVAKMIARQIPFNPKIFKLLEVIDGKFYDDPYNFKIIQFHSSIIEELMFVPTFLDDIEESEEIDKQIEPYCINKLKNPEIFFRVIHNLILNPSLYRKKSSDFIQKAIASGANPNSHTINRLDPLPLLAYITDKSHEELLSLFLQSGADPNFKINNSYNCLVYAIRTEDECNLRNKEIVKILLNSGKEFMLDSRDKEAIRKSLKIKPDIEISELLIKKGITIDSTQC